MIKYMNRENFSVKNFLLMNMILNFNQHSKNTKDCILYLKKSLKKDQKKYHKFIISVQ